MADWTPTGGRTRNTGILGQFGLGRPLALREFPGRKWKNTHFPGATGPKTEKKCYHPIQDGCLHLFYVLHFGQPALHGRENAQYGDFGPFWPGTALATNPRRGPKTEKHNSPLLGVPKWENNATTLSGMVASNFFTFYVLADRTPTGRKTQTMAVLGHFGPGQPSALGEIPGADRERKILISWC